MSLKPDASVVAYDGKDIRSLIRDVVDSLVTFSALGVARDDILRDALELFLGEGDHGL